MKWQDHIEETPGVVSGKPRLKGTRITVEFVLERLAAGDSVEVLVSQYAPLRPHHVQAAIAFALQSVRGDQRLATTA